MDSDRFDGLTRRLATGGTTRRKLLRNLGGTMAGAALAGFGVRSAVAKQGDNRVENDNRGPHNNSGNNRQNGPKSQNGLKGPLGNPGSGDPCDNCAPMCSNCPLGCCGA